MYHVAEGAFLWHVRLIQESGLDVSGLEAVRERLGRRSIARIAVRRSTDDVTLRPWLAFRLGHEGLRAGVLAVPKRLLGMRAYARLRSLLLGKGSGHHHVFEP